MCPSLLARCRAFSPFCNGRDKNDDDPIRESLQTTTYRIASVDVDPILEIFQNLLRVAPSGCSEEGGAVIRLKISKSQN